MGSVDDFARAVLQQHHLFFDLMQVIGKAGEAAVSKKAVQDMANQVCVLPLGVPHLTRRVVPLALKVKHAMSAIPTVSYDPRSITIIGGAAVQAYHAYKAVSEYDRPTTDIDAVWWPKIILPSNIRAQLLSDTTEYVSTEDAKYKHIFQTRNTPESHETNVVSKEPFRFSYSYGTRETRTYIDTASKDVLADAAQFAVVSSSKAIQALIAEYTKQLERLLEDFVQRNKKDLTVIAHDIFESPRGYVFSGAAKFKNLFVAGICNVWGYIVIHTGSGRFLGAVKIIEMTIHDGASSQRADTLEPDTTDFVFSRYQADSAITKPIAMSVPPFEFRVPFAERLLQQQIKAIELRIAEPKPDMSKLHSHAIRCRFLYKLLAAETPVGNEDLLQKYRRIFGEICSAHRELSYLCDVDIPLRTTPLPTVAPPLVFPVATAHKTTAADRALAVARASAYTPSPVAATYAATTPYATALAHTPMQQPQLLWQYVSTRADGSTLYHIIDSQTGRHINTKLIKRGGKTRKVSGTARARTRRSRQ